jgi:protein phosphatase
MREECPIDFAGLTDPGEVRERNEDQFLIGGLTKSMLVHRTSLDLGEPARLFGGTHGYVLVVADGMGGHAGGDVASLTAVDTLTHYVLNTMPWFFELDENYEDDQLALLEDALRACQASLFDRVHEGRGRAGMGTTLTMAYVLWPRLYVVHAGDSRCYLLRGSELEQITTDHTFAASMIGEGRITAEEAQRSGWSHVLWNVVGGTSDALLPEVYKAELAAGDVSPRATPRTRPVRRSSPRPSARAARTTSP